MHVHTCADRRAWTIDSDDVYLSRFNQEARRRALFPKTEACLSVGVIDERSLLVSLNVLCMSIYTAIYTVAVLSIHFSLSLYM